MSVYILHLDTKLHHAQHYVGWSKNRLTLLERIAHHRNGTARCKFTDALHRVGITFQLARVFAGKQYDRNFERKLKKTKTVRKWCPVCNGGVARPYKPKKPKEVS